MNRIRHPDWSRPDWSRIERRALLKAALRSGVAVAAASTFPAGNGFAADLQATASHGNTVVLSDAAVIDLQRNLHGPVILASSPDYESARRLWNGTFDRHPALIAKCASAADVQSAVQFARSHELLVAVRCGGHSYSGQSSCDGGMVIDLGLFNSVEVDPGARVARVSGGTFLGEMDRATMAHGLATTAGVVSHTGIGGLATGGGQGRLQRKFGLTVDNIRSVEVVTADGRLLRASAAENSDLYWAVRGGGGNFGIVSMFEMQLHQIDPTVTSFSYVFPVGRAKDVMKFYFDFSPAAPDDLSLSAGLRTSDKGETTISISGGYIGSPQAAETVMEPIKLLGTPISARISGINYLTLQSAADAAFKPGRNYYTRVAFQNSVDPKLGDAMVDSMTQTPRPHMSLALSQQGGASGRIAQDATAYPNRDAQYQLSMSVDWDDPKDGPGYLKQARELWSEIKPRTDGGFYTNHTVDESEAEIRKNYGGNYARLVTIKTKYDPTNFFHLNANVKPKNAV